MILVPNHVSHFDPLVVAHYIYRAGRWPRFLGKASLWKVPVLGFLLRKTLQIPVERGSVEAVKSLDALVEALDEGGTVVIYPEGTTTREPDLWPMRGKTGAARLALLTGAPVIPIANWGAERVFDPRTNKFKAAPAYAGERHRGRTDRPVPVGRRRAEPAVLERDDRGHHAGRP